MTQTPSLLILGALCMTVNAAAQEITATEREDCLRYLASSRKGLVESVQGLTEEQWKFKPAPDRWSIAEVVEHVALIEDRIHAVAGGLRKGEVASPGRDFKKIDAMLLERVPDRSEKIQAPPTASPTGRWTGSEALKHFVASRTETASLLQSTPDLRGHTIAHPIFGPMDGYEWILATAGHSERHTKQILEVKADPHFPAGPQPTR